MQLDLNRYIKKIKISQFIQLDCFLTVDSVSEVNYTDFVMELLQFLCLEVVFVLWKVLLLFLNYFIENSYASNGVKHCIRPCDMTGKSAALILRQMHPNMMNEALKYDSLVDFPAWFSTLSIKENAVSYTQQKSIEAEKLMKLCELDRRNKKTRYQDQNTHNNYNEEITNTLNDIIYTIELSALNSENNKKKKGRQKADY